MRSISGALRSGLSVFIAFGKGDSEHAFAVLYMAFYFVVRQAGSFLQLGVRIAVEIESREAKALFFGQSGDFGFQPGEFVFDGVGIFGIGSKYGFIRERKPGSRPQLHKTVIFEYGVEPGPESVDLGFPEFGYEGGEDLHEGVFGFFGIAEVFEAYAIGKAGIPGEEFVHVLRLAIQLI